MTILNIAAFLAGVITVLALFYILGQRQMDEIGRSFAAAQPSCPYCQGDLAILDRTVYDSRDKVRLKCDCGARIVVYGWRKWSEQEGEEEEGKEEAEKLEALYEILEHWHDDALDFVVHELKSEEAAEINNGGRDNQIEFLAGVGWKPEGAFPKASEGGK